MEFYKIMHPDGRYCLEEEAGQEGAPLDNQCLSVLALQLGEYHRIQDIDADALPLRFRKYMTVYYANGELEYVALTDGAQLCQFPQIDGFAHTWLDGEGEHEEENRVWFGADGVVENRGPSAEKVRIVLERLLDALNQT
mgnify:FL=1